ncbi:F0F1 ATP synthase subunit delta [Candidatus Peregrinibacteria bacterium]|nr:F0F1 ATP synthase subunit delta [Candidatus Peregrinibacteria bacterium]
MKVSIKKYAEALAHSLEKGESEADTALKIGNFFKLLRKKKKAGFLRRFFPVFERVWMEKNDQLAIKATFPSQPDDRQKKDLEKSLGEVLKKNVVLDINADEKMIGGLKLEFDDYVIDGSVRRNLEVLNSKLINS